MEASSNQQQKEKEPRVHRPYAFDKVYSFLARKTNRSPGGLAAERRLTIKRRLGLISGSPTEP